MKTLLKLLLLNLFLCGVCYAPPLKPFRGAVLPHGRASSRGLVLYLPFNEGSGNIVSDLSGNGWLGTFGAGAASPSWTAGKFGSALSFDGGDYVDIGTPQSLIGSDRTIICWAKADDWHIANNMLYGFGDYGINCSTYTGGAVGQVIFRTETGDRAEFSDASMTVGTWHQIGVIIGADGTVDEMFLDGLSKGSAGNTGYSLYLLANQIGAQGNDKFFAGLIDSVLVYNRALTASEIAELYQDSFRMSRIYWNWGVFGTISVVTDVYSGRGIGRGVGRGLVR